MPLQITKLMMENLFNDVRARDVIGRLTDFKDVHPPSVEPVNM